jgi:hypothetical protein
MTCWQSLSSKIFFSSKAIIFKRYILVFINITEYWKFQVFLL